MGLDMNLYRETYMSEYHDNPSLKITAIRDGKDTTKQVRIVLEDVHYWRKANAIHAWFVDNCADGVDECQRISVSYEQLCQLRDLCKQVLDDHSKAKELLPTREGFFFGSTEYDEWYFKGIEETYDVLKEELDHQYPSDYMYWASW